MRSITAVGEIVVVEVSMGKEKVSTGGIILSANTDKETQSQATVISVGEDVKGISVGDTVIIARAGMGEMFQLDEKYYRAMPKNEIFAIIKENV